MTEFSSSGRYRDSGEVSERRSVFLWLGPFLDEDTSHFVYHLILLSCWCDSHTQSYHCVTLLSVPWRCQIWTIRCPRIPFTTPGTLRRYHLHMTHVRRATSMLMCIKLSLVCVYVWQASCCLWTVQSGVLPLMAGTGGSLQSVTILPM